MLFRSCLEFHIGNCKGPCEGLQPEEDYNRNIQQIRLILKGNISSVIGHLSDQMQEHAAKFEYEAAQQIKEKLERLEKFHKKSVIVNPSIHNVDVFSIKTENDFAVVNFLKVMNGSIIQAHTVELKKKLDETQEELLELAIAELRERFSSDSTELILPFHLDLEMKDVEITVPKIGDKKHLLLLSEKNVHYYLQEKQLQFEKTNPENKVLRLMEVMKKDLRLKELPRHIECFDNSNFQGDFAVAALTVFRNGKPSKKEYRHFNIKTVEGPDDFASMEEIVFRRYKRMIDEARELPQLIVIDGGKGQLGAAMSSLEKLNLSGKIAVIGIAKKLEELYYPGDSVPLYLDKKSETLRVIQQIRDEAHRFGITHHRNKRSKAFVKTELHEIKGIGEKTAEDLLRHFKSVKRIREASPDEISEVIGKSKSELIIAHFSRKPNAD